MTRWLSILLAAAVIAAACTADSDADQAGDGAGVDGGSSAPSSNPSSAVTSDPTTTTNPSTTAPPTTTTIKPPPEPETDPEVLADFVEERSGLLFPEVPEVDYDEGDRDELEDAAEWFIAPRLWEVFRALGLVQGNDEARLTAGQARLDQVRGLCCPVTMFPNEDHPLLTSVVLVHELTHLLDNERPEPQFFPDREVISTYTAVVEGNAQRVARAYQDELEEAGADPSLFIVDWSDERIPRAVLEVFEFPYQEGQEFSRALEARGGLELVDQSFLRPPTTTEQVLDVDAYLADERSVDVATPSPPPGAEELDRGALGSFVLRLVIDTLPDGPDDDDTLALVTSWAGDAYLLYDDGGRSCLTATVVMDDAASAAEMARLLTDAGLDARGDGDTIDVSRCAPSPA